MKTELITYHLGDRGRKHRGQDRDYQAPENIPSVVSAINSSSTQERVKQRDMHGYFGHGIRKLFGLIPPECKLINGKIVCVEPAFATTHLKAYKDGTVEHINEFADNKYGEMSWNMYKSRLGGFSSAISEYSNPVGFHGFDWVCEPNFTTNRGWTLDSIDDDEALDDESIVLINNYMALVSETKGLVMDSITSGLDEKFNQTMQKMALLEAENQRLSEAMLSVSSENDELVAMLARVPKRRTEPSFDQVEPIITNQAAFDSLGDDSFLTADLAKFESNDPKEKVVKVDSIPSLTGYLSRLL